jgi:competence ComEA-like helix-hairpin-helix protein
MASPADRRAAAVLLLLAAVGLVVRFWQVPGAAPGGVVYRPVGGTARASRDSVAARAARLLRPLSRGEQIDLDRAGASELTRLPHVGPGLAGRIVAYRDAHGPFGSLKALDQVPGIGPTVIEAIRPHARFSAAGLVRQGVPAALGGAEIPLIRDPEDPSASPAASPGPGERPGSGQDVVSLNTATEAELEQLPGIGPALAHAIVAERTAHGPFASVADLARVKGIGAATVRRLEGRIVVP